VCQSHAQEKPMVFLSFVLEEIFHFDTIQDIPTPPPKKSKGARQIMHWRFKDGKGGWATPTAPI